MAEEITLECPVAAEMSACLQSLHQWMDHSNQRRPCQVPRREYTARGRERAVQCLHKLSAKSTVQITYDCVLAKKCWSLVLLIGLCVHGNAISCRYVCRSVRRFQFGHISVMNLVSLRITDFSVIHHRVVSIKTFKFVVAEIDRNDRRAIFSPVKLCFFIVVVFLEYLQTCVVLISRLHVVVLYFHNK